MGVPYYVGCKESSVPMYRLTDGRFQLTKEGPISPFMNGYGYFLLEEPFANFLEQLDICGIRFQRATIWHRRLNIEYTTHKLLTVDRYFTLETVNELDTTGERLFALNDTYLFASPTLKERLETS